MCTGIIEEIGELQRHEGGELVIGCSLVIEGTQLGDSIAVNGVDLTVRRIDDDALIFDVMPETVRRSNLGNLPLGSPLNLERSVRPSDRLSGHLVRGVVETTATLESLTPEGDALIARYRVPQPYMKYIVTKGPVCVDGASLTVIERDEQGFAVSLVQYTQQHTNLTRRTLGDSINLETDIVARYVEQLVEPLFTARDRV